MHPIRSVLWIGPASGLADSGALDCPSLDVTWVPGLGDAPSLAPASFGVEILDGVGNILADQVKRPRRSARRSPVLGRTRVAHEAEDVAHHPAGPDHARERRIRARTAGFRAVPRLVFRELVDATEEMLDSLRPVANCQDAPGARGEQLGLGGLARPHEHG